MKVLLVQRLDTANYFRKVKLYCDGKKIGVLGFAEWEEFKIPANSREVYAKIDWCKSKPIALDPDNNEEAILVECNNILKHIFLSTDQYLELHHIKRRDLPMKEELRAFRYNFRKVAGLSTLALLIFTAFLLYTLDMAIFQNSTSWYLLSAVASYNIYRIGKSMRKRLRGQVD